MLLFANLLLVYRLFYFFATIMGNDSGKFNASTVAGYTHLDLIKHRTCESKESAADVLTTRSSKALSLVRSGFDKKFGTNCATDSDELLNVTPSQAKMLLFHTNPSTPAPARTSTTRLQFTPCDDGPKLVIPSPDRQGCDEPPSPFEAYKSVTDQPLRRIRPHEIVINQCIMT
jgi:hypothetical protein